MNYAYVDSPLGKVLIAGDDSGLKKISFMEGSTAETPHDDWTENPRALSQARKQLREYFAGKRKEFSLTLAPEGTPFQQRVWRELQRIPYGMTISYGDLARRVRKPTASRAVGAANGKNPLPIVIPCHRVIGASGDLTGFGGGLHLKVGLLTLEDAMPEASKKKSKLKASRATSRVGSLFA
jgi:methylated-DNA-[protein]-cysteine S-methyltransferase